eukprot:156927-Hanusia_phi.AAC.1
MDHQRPRAGHRHRNGRLDGELQEPELATAVDRHAGIDSRAAHVVRGCEAAHPGVDHGEARGQGDVEESHQPGLTRACQGACRGGRPGWASQACHQAVAVVGADRAGLAGVVGIGDLAARAVALGYVRSAHLRGHADRTKSAAGGRAVEARRADALERAIRVDADRVQVVADRHVQRALVHVQAGLCRGVVPEASPAEGARVLHRVKAALLAGAGGAVRGRVGIAGARPADLHPRGGVGAQRVVVLLANAVVDAGSPGERRHVVGAGLRQRAAYDARPSKHSAVPLWAAALIHCVHALRRAPPHAGTVQEIRRGHQAVRIVRAGLARTAAVEVLVLAGRAGIAHVRISLVTLVTPTDGRRRVGSIPQKLDRVHRTEGTRAVDAAKLQACVRAGHTAPGRRLVGTGGADTVGLGRAPTVKGRPVRGAGRTNLRTLCCLVGALRAGGADDRKLPPLDVYGARRQVLVVAHRAGAVVDAGARYVQRLVVEGAGGAVLRPRLIRVVSWIAGDADTSVSSVVSRWAVALGDARRAEGGDHLHRAALAREQPSDVAVGPGRALDDVIHGVQKSPSPGGRRHVEPRGSHAGRRRGAPVGADGVGRARGAVRPPIRVRVGVVRAGEARDRACRRVAAQWAQAVRNAGRPGRGRGSTIRA